MPFLRYYNVEELKDVDMKNLKQVLTVVFGCFVAFTAFSQEFDDMYFNSKDRAKLNEGKISADLGLTKKNGEIREVNSSINPTDSYSARNINPEYSSQLKSGSEPVIEDNYFIQDFQPKGVNQNISNCNCGPGSYYNPYYGNNAWNNPYYGNMGGFGSPFSSYYGSSWGYPSYGGFNSGLSMSMGYGWGGFSPGFYSGMGYGYGSYSNFWNPYSNPWRNGYGGYYGSYYPGQVIIINNGDTGETRVSYSKRSSRSSNINHTVDNPRPSSVANINNTTSRSAISNGRSRTATPEYYDRGWKRTQSENNATRGYWNNSNFETNSSTRSAFDRSNFNSNSGGRQGSSGFSTPTRSSFGSGGVNSGGSRSGSSGSSSGSKTRTRNN